MHAANRRLVRLPQIAFGSKGVVVNGHRSRNNLAPTTTVAAAANGDTDVLAALPDDALLQNFSHVRDVKDLFLFAVTSKWWLRLFTDPGFLRRLWPGPGQGRHGARRLSFFFQRTSFLRSEKMMKERLAQHASAFAPTFIPTPGSPLGPMDRDLTSFVADDDGTFNYAAPLAARRNIVLRHLVPYTFDLEGNTKPGLLVGLCNPITGERHVVPPPECTCLGQYVDGYAIVTAADSDLDGKQQPSTSSGHSMFSQLLLTTQHEKDSHLYLHSYSAATRSWSAPTVCLQRDRFHIAGSSSAVVHGGAAHWLYLAHIAVARTPQDNKLDLYKLSVEVGTSTTRVSLTKLPVRVGWPPFLGVSSDGKLSIISVYPVHVTVWTLQDGDDGEGAPAAWLRTQVIRVPMPVLDPNKHTVLQRRDWFDFNRGAMLVLYKGGGVFILDIEKKVMEKVMDCTPRLFSEGHEQYVPFEMDLVH